MKKSKQLFLYSFLFGLIIFLDRITKYLMRASPKKYYINDFLSFILQYNRGISWGMLHSDSSLAFTVITIIIATFITLFFFYTTLRYISNYFIIGEVMVCAGALSNLIDRLWYGGVADFILVSFGSWDFPIFNVADIFIVGGLGLMIVAEFLSHEK